MSNIDYLTGLSGRKGLYDYYDTLRKDETFHALFLDVDNFKRVNDTYGHHTGDQLLRAIASLLRERTDGFVCRMGGDEYVILLSGALSLTEVTAYSNELLAAMEEIEFHSDILSLISLSIGISMNEHPDQPLDDILAKCDEAMYRAKNSGKNRYAIYTEDDCNLQMTHKIESEMEAALDNDEFVLYLQPKVNMITSALYGAEAVSRWHHPTEGIRPATLYIPLFEKNGFIRPLDIYMFRKLCQIKASWKGKPFEHIPLSINMSRLHLYDKAFPETLRSIADSYDVAPQELEIEITESVFIKDNMEMIHTVNRLRECGFSVCIDDFGSGFSALNIFKDLPVDTIKLSKDLLHDCIHSSRGRKVIRNVISLCRDLQMNIITEGIENKEEQDFILSCDCPNAQGYFYSYPLVASDFELYAREHSLCLNESHNFLFDGTLVSEDGLFEGFAPDMVPKFREGIFRGHQALYFPGGDMEEHTLLLPEDALTSDSFTLSLWLKPQKLTPWSCAMYIKYETGFLAILPQAWEGVSACRIRDSRNIHGWHDLSSAPLGADTWHHYTVTYNAKTETLTSFINGEPVGVLENIPTNRYVKQIRLGGDPYQLSYQGLMCELLIYNEVKDYDFIRTLHQSYTERADFVGF